MSKQQWGSIDINTETGLVFVEEDWFYNWESLDPNHPHWSVDERRAFHKVIDEQIWKTWSGRIRLHVQGGSPFARRFAQAGVKVNFHAKWVLAHGNWRVRAVKVAANDNVFRRYAPATPMGTKRRVKVAANDNVFRREQVDSANRTILLYTSAAKSYAATNDAHAVNRKFFANPHEFGHTMNNPDEYGAASPNLVDSNSIMNIGKQVRERHLKLLIDTLNGMLPQSQFTPWII